MHHYQPGLPEDVHAIRNYYVKSKFSVPVALIVIGFAVVLVIGGLASLGWVLRLMEHGGVR